MKVITLCGSTKFKKQFREAEANLTLQGNIVLSLGFFKQSDGIEITEAQARLFEEMHFRKIDMSDEIFVIDVDGYIGSSTRNEIDYAKRKGKVVRYYTDDAQKTAGQRNRSEHVNDGALEPSNRTADSTDKLRVVIGAGEYNNNPGWIQTEQTELDLLKRSDWQRRFTPNSIAVIVAEHVWEHLDDAEGARAARTCYEFLKPGGYVRCAVPDGYFPNDEYQKAIQVGGPGPRDHPAASHKIVHDYQTLSAMFEEAGFTVKLLEYCDEEGHFHYHPWDEKEGFIYRSKRFDHRNQDGKIGFVSLIVDAIKPELE